MLSEEVDSTLYHATRITSYNVCYTKLLRALAQGDAELVEQVLILAVECGLDQDQLGKQGARALLLAS